MLSDVIMILALHFSLSTIICVSIHHKQNTKPVKNIKKSAFIYSYVANNKKYYFPYRKRKR